MNNIKKIIGLNLGIIIAAVIAYSPGFLNLRPSDESILRAGFSILIAIGLIILFIHGNMSLLKEPEKIKYTKENLKSLNDAKNILQSYRSGKHFGPVANTVITQINRLEKSVYRSKTEINSRFERGSLSWQKYYEAVEEANEMALENAISLTNRIQMFDEDEYSRLLNYESDNIPDNIQRQQLDLYDQNMKLVNSAITVNENLILGLDKLTTELSMPGEIEEHNTSLLSDIKKLTDEVKYYV